jgi:hydroxymethylpyrimidine/phosphomethylpyrimidine kinase
MLFSRALIEPVADFLEAHPVPLVVDPVMIASSGSKLLEDDAVDTLVDRLFPLATVVTPNLAEAQALARVKQQTVTKFELAERIHALGAAAVIVTGGHGEPVDHLFDGTDHVEIPVPRYDVAATHGAGCTHSAALTGLLAHGWPLGAAAREAAVLASRAVEHGHPEIGRGEGPVDVLAVVA